MEGTTEASRNQNVVISELEVEKVEIVIMEVDVNGTPVGFSNSNIAAVIDNTIGNPTISPIVATDVGNSATARNQEAEICGTIGSNIGITEDHIQNKQVVFLTSTSSHNVDIVEIADTIRNHNSAVLQVEDATRNPTDAVETVILRDVLDHECLTTETCDTNSESLGNHVVSSGVDDSAASVNGSCLETPKCVTSENNGEENSDAKGDTNSRRGKRLAKCSGYNVFFQEYLIANPKKSFGNVAKAASKLWKSLSIEQKQDYTAHAQKHTQQLETQLHAGDKKYVCTKCGRKVAHHKNFANHLKECGQKFPCTDCDVVFMERRNLIKHISAVHQKVKTYRCKTCKKGFAYRKDLMRHMVQHSGDRPFQCPTCFLKFAWQCNLRRHLVKQKHGQPANTVDIALEVNPESDSKTVDCCDTDTADAEPETAILGLEQVKVESELAHS